MNGIAVREPKGTLFSFSFLFCTKLSFLSIYTHWFISLCCSLSPSVSPLYMRYVRVCVVVLPIFNRASLRVTWISKKKIACGPDEYN
jgi:hypothetical protein